LFGLTVYPSVEDIPDQVDLAAVSVPGRLVSGALEACLKKGIQAAIVLSGGFGETGEEGKRLEEDLSDVSAEGIRKTRK